MTVSIQTINSESRQWYEERAASAFMVQNISGRPVTSDLDTWNLHREAYWNAVRDRIKNPSKYPNGLICPKCEGNLYDTGQVVSNSPTMLRVKCQSTGCDFKGARYD